MLTLFIYSVLFGLFIKFLYNSITKNKDFFSKNGVKFLKPYPLLGNSGVFMLRKKSLGQFLSETYAEFPSEKIIGIFDFMTPVYFLRDPELIKKLLVKDFDHFPNHQQLFTPENDPMLGNVLPALAGQEWRGMCSTLSPGLTGSNMRQMFNLIIGCSEQWSKFFVRRSIIEPLQVFDMKQMFSLFTNDSIATTAFRIKVNSFHNHMKKNLINLQTIRRGVKANSLHLTNTFDIQFPNDDNITKFFRQMINDTMIVRNARHQVRPDIIQLLKQVHKGNLKLSEDTFLDTKEGCDISSEDELVAKCLIFCIAGFDTTSTILSFAANELALNPDIQEKLYHEVMSVQEKLNGNPLTYEVLNSMQYMEMVVSESLRKWPPAPIIDRKCDKDYQLAEGTQYNFTINKGDKLWVPIYALHHDPTYFPDPEKFEPERFNKEKIGQIVPGTYLPFGIGPRICIGSRFALINIKAAIYHLLKDFKVEMCENTVVPLQMGAIVAMPTKGIHLGLKTRATPIRYP